MRIIICSATLDLATFCEFFDNPGILKLSGNCFPVDIYYLNSPAANYIDTAVSLLSHLHSNFPAGDVLVFLTGKEDINLFISAVSLPNLKVFPLYADLPFSEQQKAIEPAAQRKVIAATNIAETAITIDSVVYIIDCCYSKVKVNKDGVEHLIVTSISKDSAKQRAGRAGRVSPGKAFRLCTQHDYSLFPEKNSPEILRVGLSDLTLYLKALGMHNIPQFPVLSSPSKDSWVDAFALLYSLGALNDEGELTRDIGYLLTEFPVDPKLAVVLLNSGRDQFHCSREMLSIVSMLSVRNIFIAKSTEQLQWVKRKLGSKEGDHITALNILENFNKSTTENKRSFCRDFKLNFKALSLANSIREQLRKLLLKFHVKILSAEYDVESILRCLVTGLFPNAAQRLSNGLYRTLKSDLLFTLHPSSILASIKPPWLVFSTVISQGSQSFLCDASEIDADWLTELAPHFYKDTRILSLKAAYKGLSRANG